MGMENGDPLIVLIGRSIGPPSRSVPLLPFPRSRPHHKRHKGACAEIVFSLGRPPLLCGTELGYKVGPRFGEFFSCCCLPLLPGLACSIHATWGLPVSRALSSRGLPPPAPIASPDRSMDVNMGILNHHHRRP